jgi:4-methyl-5(b-hydroxyethyl)-thiazole monophosphate biosynthesis
MLSSAPLKTVLVPIADDSEEIETACITDTLVRAGASVTVASVMEEGRLQVTMSRGLKVVADTTIMNCADRSWDAIVLPGGMPGAEHLRDCATLTKMLAEHSAAGKTTAAVCASPAVVFATHGLLPAAATCYPAPAFKDKVPGWSTASVIVDGHVITSQGPGTSLKFALKLVAVLFSEEKASEIASQMLTETA